MASQTTNQTPGEPIACTLEPSDQKARIEAWQALRRDALIEEIRVGVVSTTLWRRRAGVVERLEQLMEAERACCSFLDFQLEESSTIRLTTTFPPGAEAILDLVFG
jgi:hypothetical protein